MKVYCVIIEDRHSDVDVEPFGEEIRAIVRARELAHLYDRHGDYDEQELNGSMIQNGWKFYAQYSCEGDSVRVVERDLL